MKALFRISFSVVVMVICLSVMLSWLMHYPFSAQFSPMRFNTAVMFFLAGLGLCVLEKWGKLSGVIGVLIIFFVSLTLLQHMTGADFGIDQLLFHHANQIGVPYPGRMSPYSGISLILFGLFLFFEGFFSQNAIANQWAIFSVLMTGVVGFYLFFGYVFNIPVMHTWGTLTVMSLPSSICAILSAVGAGPIIRKRFLQSVAIDDYLLCVLTATIGLSLILFAWQSLLAYENQRLTQKMREDLNVMVNELQSRAAGKAVGPSAELKLFRHTITSIYFKKYCISLRFKGVDMPLVRNNVDENTRCLAVISRQFSMFGGEWILSLSPTKSFFQSELTGLPNIFLIFGLVSIVLFVVSIRIWQLYYRENKQIRLIDQATLIVSDTQDTALAMRRCLQLICESIGWSVGHILLRKKNGHAFLESSHIWFFKYSDQLEKLRDISEKMRFEKGVGLSGRVWQLGKAIWVEDAIKDKRVLGIEREGMGIRTMVAFPVFCHGEIVSIFEFYSIKVRPHSKALMRVFEILSEQIGRVFERKQAVTELDYMAHHDHLTGTANRVQFEKVGRESILRAAQHQKKVAFFALDLDGFKKINDTFGHEVGDIYLQTAAKRLQNAIRSIDLLARVGGDEFVVIVEDVDNIEQIALVARKLLSAIRDPISIEGKIIQLTVSIGIAICPDHGDSLLFLIRNADQALYAAKSAGKNQYCFYAGETR